MEQKNDDGKTGYDKLSEKNKNIIVEYIAKRKLNLRKIES